MNRQVPILGQSLTREQAAKIEIAQAINSLSLGIYSQLAVAHLASRDVHQDVGQATLRGMAKNAHLAAQMYFEGLGIIKT